METNTGTPTNASAPAAGGGNVSVEALGALLNQKRASKRTPAPAAKAASGASGASDAGAGGSGKSGAAESAAAGATQSQEQSTAAAGAETELQQSSAAAGAGQESGEQSQTGESTATEPEGESIEGVEDGAESDGVEEGAEGEQSKGKNPIRKMERRISKLTKQIKDREVLLETAMARISELEGKAGDRGEARAEGATRAKDEFGAVPEVAQLNHDLADVENILKWVAENPEGGEAEGKVFDERQVRAIKANAESRKLELLADRSGLVRQLKAERQQMTAASDAQAAKVYPYLTDKTSENYLLVERMLKDFPEIAHHPARKFIAADYLRGRKARMDEEAAAAKPKPKLPATLAGAETKGKGPTNVIAMAGSVAPRTSAGNTVVKEADTKFRQSGSADDLAKMLAAKRRLRAA